ncbi:MAG TPA: RHS repeat-associated core domain-containing protein, partial [Prosthecobacter sp.]|nr:RHS repeat-associated core domain-containing protein [Prosthecobacter sp.]HRK14810.1 RHS repeat-associated core domain-containing protein [Prosthecobacter sp.]
LETMTWLSRDPAGFVDGPNLYAYVKQNPWSGFDPKGLNVKATTKKETNKQGNQYDHTKIEMNVVVVDGSKGKTVGKDKGNPIKLNLPKNLMGYKGGSELHPMQIEAIQASYDSNLLNLKPSGLYPWGQTNGPKYKIHN